MAMMVETPVGCFREIREILSIKGRKALIGQELTTPPRLHLQSDASRQLRKKTESLISINGESDPMSSILLYQSLV